MLKSHVVSSLPCHPRHSWSRLRSTAGLILLLQPALAGSALAQTVTNWVAVNDHAPGPLTAPYVTAYNMRGVGLPGTPTLLLPSSGPLTNALATGYPPGYSLPAGIIVTAANVPNLFPNAALSTPFPNTPAYQLFNGVVDLGNADSAVGLSAAEGDQVTLTFTNLDPAMRYVFYGTVVRNGTTANVHPGRWSVSSISGAASFTTAHTPGVLTSTTPGVPGLTLTNGQGVFQAGVNTNGEMVGWTAIQPAPNGTFSVITRGYSGPVVGGTFGTLVTNAFDNLGYALCAFALAEYGPLTGVALTTSPVASLTVTQSQALLLTAKASGSSPNYQWHKTGLGPIPGAIAPVYSIPHAAVADSGTYFVVVSNAVSQVTSPSSAVTVVADSTPPVVTKVIPSATLDKVTVEFDELLGDNAADEFYYSVAQTGGADLLVASAVLNADGKSVLLTLSPGTALAADTAYALNVGEIRDFAGNAKASGAVPFQTFTAAGTHGLTFEAYRPIAGNYVSNLTSSASFPGSPVDAFTLTRFDSREVYPDDTHETYGARLRGLFIPQISGSYKFYLSSDDGSELWINPAGPNSGGKIKIAEEPTCCHTFVEDSPGSLTSKPFPLSAGVGYYIEALYKEGGGGDFCKVAYKRVEDPTDPGTLSPIPGELMGYPIAPAGVGGPVTITQMPSSLSVLENGSYVFSVNGTNINGLPLSYQWRSNGVDIAGAISQSYTGSLASAALNNGATFVAAVSVIGTTTLSDPATLTVIPDTTPPTIVSVTADEFFKKITVVFSELIDPATAIDEFAYTFTSPSGTIEIGLATLLSDGKTVVLTLTEKMAPDTAYAIAAPYINDIKGNTFNSPPTPFRSYALTCCFLNFAAYATGGGNDVSILTSHPTFPDSPSQRLFMPSFNTRTIYPDDSHEGFGARITGVFIPPNSGNWIFYLRSDDASELYLNPAGTDADGKALITAEPGCCNPFSAHASAPQALTAGVPVYIEALYKEGVGGDVCQVAAKLDTDPATPDSLPPIPGIYLGCYVNTLGATVQITSQPTNAIVGVSTPPSSVGLVTFNAGVDGFSVINGIAPGNVPGPAEQWLYNPARGTWFANGGEGVKNSALNSPSLQVPQTGPVTLNFKHRYNFEDDGSTRWDGGQLRLSVNGAPYVAVPAASITGETYKTDKTIGGNSPPIAGQFAFNGTSPGFNNGTFVDSQAALGTFSAGDSLSIQFIGAWDEGFVQTPAPNWEIDSVEFIPALEDRTADGSVTFAVTAVATLAGVTNPPLAYQWQVNLGGGFTDILGATGASYSFVPGLDQNGALYRVLVRTPGASVTSAEAMLILAPALTVVPATGSATLAWPSSMTGFTLQAAASLAPVSGATAWAPVGIAPVVINGYYTVTVPTAGTTFFRLTK